MSAKKLLKCPVWNIRRLSRHISNYYDKSYSKVGLKNTQFTILSVVQTAGPLSINELAEYVGADRTTLTRNLSVLEKQALVSVTKSKEDPRMKDVVITQRGMRVYESTYPIWDKNLKDIQKILGKDDWKKLSKLMRKIDKGIAEMDNQTTIK